MRPRSLDARLICLFLAILFAPLVLLAEDRAVKIGFPSIPGIHETDRTGKRSGYFFELEEVLAKKYGWNPEYVEAPWNSCLTMLDSGEIDLLGFIGKDYTGYRLFEYNHENILATWSSLLLQPHATYSGIENIHGKTIALVRGKKETNEFLELVMAANITVIPVYSDDADVQIQSFLSGKTEGIILPSYLIASLMKKRRYTETHIFFAPQSHGFAVKAGTNGTLLSEIDSGLREIKDSTPDFLFRLKERHLDPPKVYSIPRWLIILLVILVFAGVASAVFIIMLRYQIRMHTLTLTRQKDELQRIGIEARMANKELESFAYSVSHDLRAPLRAIDGFSHFLVERHGDELSESARNLVAKIRANTLRMDELIRSLLELSRAGKTSLVYSKIDMKSLVESVLSEVGIEEEIASFTIHIGDLPEAWGDATLLSQVWANLISNALKYSRKSSLKSIRIEGVKRETESRYQVTDKGAGFDPAYTGKLFQVFQRLHSSSEYPGTGVGLALVQRIIHRHGGTVSAEGQVGEGATFTFSLPAGKIG